MLVELLVRRGAGLGSDHLAPARVERGGRSLARGRVRARERVGVGVKVGLELGSGSGQA